MLSAWISLSCSFKQCLISYYVQSIILDTLKNMKMYKGVFLSRGYSVTVENKTNTQNWNLREYQKNTLIVVWTKYSGN